MRSVALGADPARAADAFVALRDRRLARSFCSPRSTRFRAPDLGVLVEQAEALRTSLATLPAGSRLGTRLTGAELRLLPLLTTHLSFREIGERLYLSRNTIKTQAISVYRKLGVSTRSDAMDRAPVRPRRRDRSGEDARPGRPARSTWTF